MKESEKEITIRDAITAGLAKALKDKKSRSLVEVTPRFEGNQTVYDIRGDVAAVLQKIAANAPVGSRDALEAIKNCRSAIYLFRQGVSK